MRHKITVDSRRQILPNEMLLIQKIQAVKIWYTISFLFYVSYAEQLLFKGLPSTSNLESKFRFWFQTTKNPLFKMFKTVSLKDRKN